MSNKFMASVLSFFLLLVSNAGYSYQFLYNNNYGSATGAKPGSIVNLHGYHICVSKDGRRDFPYNKDDSWQGYERPSRYNWGLVHRNHKDCHYSYGKYNFRTNQFYTIKQTGTPLRLTHINDLRDNAPIKLFLSGNHGYTAPCVLSNGMAGTTFGKGFPCYVPWGNRVHADWYFFVFTY